MCSLNTLVKAEIQSSVKGRGEEAPLKKKHKSPPDPRAAKMEKDPIDKLIKHLFQFSLRDTDRLGMCA